MTGVGARLLDEESTSGVVGMQRGLGREDFGGITWFLGGEQRGITRSQCVKGEGGLKEINRPPPNHTKDSYLFILFRFCFCLVLNQNHHVQQPVRPEIELLPQGLSQNIDITASFSQRVLSEVERFCHDSHEHRLSHVP